MSLKLLRSCRSDERGVALVMALLMILAVSILTAGLVVVANSETLSSLNYTTMTQVRYGAESGIHAAANYLLHPSSYTPPSAASATDPFAAYDMTKSPVTLVSNGDPVVLSSDPTVPSNYPSNAVADAFAAASGGKLNVNSAPVEYRARATLLSMRVLKDFSTNQDVTLQRWEIVGSGRVSGAGASLVEVSAVIERQPVPVFAYAAFATYNGCSALRFGGGAETDSYDSRLGLPPTIDPSGGNVGTNGNLDADGATTEINGTLSTPRTGVGDCTANNVTAATISGFGKVNDGLVTLPQPITFPTPPDFEPLLDKVDFKSGCDGVSDCVNAGGVVTITPPASTSTIKMGNVNLNSGIVLHLNAGTYEINSITLNGTAQIVVDSGPVIIKVAGHGESTPISLEGNGISNPSLNPANLQFIYGGEGKVKVTGGSEAAALVYAPKASGSLTGNSDFYGSIITKLVTDLGDSRLHYDRALESSTMTAGNPTMTTFTWRSF